MAKYQRSRSLNVSWRQCQIQSQLNKPWNVTNARQSFASILFRPCVALRLIQSFHRSIDGNIERLQCGGNESSVTPFSDAKSIASTDRSDTWTIEYSLWHESWISSIWPAASSRIQRIPNRTDRIIVHKTLIHFFAGYKIKWWYWIIGCAQCQGHNSHRTARP